MTVSRDELRDDLVAMVAAAPEMAPEDREHLADVFLDRLEEGYRLVPRTASVPNPMPSRRPRSGPPVVPRMVGALVAFGLMLMVSLLLFSAFAFHRPPIFLFAILIFAALRFGLWGPRRRAYR